MTKVLTKQNEAVAWSWNSPLWECETAGTNWEFENPGGNISRAYSLNNYIDLTGLSKREKTVFIQNLKIDYQFIPSATDAVAGDGVTAFFIVSDIPLTLAGLTPGYGFNNSSAQNCALFQQDVWKATQDTAQWSSYLELAGRVRNGLMSATASDRLYLSMYYELNTKKIGTAPVSTMSNVTFPGVRLVVAVDVKEEPEYQYLMRLKRSYELQQRYDED
jgi:hypothetical protein